MPEVRQAPTSAEGLAQNSKSCTGRSARDPFEVAGDDWVAEPKYDGWRGLIQVVEGGAVEVWSRSAKRYSSCVPEICDVLAGLPAGTWIDGEIVCLEDSSWNVVQSALGGGNHSPHLSPRLTFVAFDLIAYADMDARPLAFSQRREILEGVFERHELGGCVKLIERVPCTPEAGAAALARGEEGLILKDPNAVYRSGQRAGSVKFKPQETVDGVVMGYNMSESAGNRGLIGSIIVGQYDETGDLVEVLHCSGMNMDVRRDISANMHAWMNTVVEVKHHRLPDGTIRHPQFNRVREDKSPRECVLG